nr:substrate-binding domain-containing protein [Thalassobius sp. Cn5-15]
MSKALAEGKSGNIRVGVVPALGENIAAQAIADVTQGSSELNVAVEVLNSHELMHLVQAGRLDFACIFGKAHDLPVETIFETSIQVNCVLPSGYLNGCDNITLEEYVRLPLSLMRPTDPIGRLILEACSAKNLHPNSMIELRNCRASIAFAEKGVAVGVADDITLSGAMLAQSRAVPFNPPLNIEVTLVRKAGHLASIAEDQLVEAFRNALVNMYAA